MQTVQKACRGKASKEAIYFECSLERTKLQTFVAALLTSTSIRALAGEIVKVFACQCTNFRKLLTLRLINIPTLTVNSEERRKEGRREREEGIKREST